MKLFLEICNMSFTASFAILFVLVFRFLFRKAPKAFSYYLWWIVWFRLLCPFSVESVVSLIPARQPTAAPVLEDGTGLWTEVWDPAVGSKEAAASQQAPAPAVFQKTENYREALLRAGRMVWGLGAFSLIMYNLILAGILKRQLRNAQRIGDNIYLSHNLKTPFAFGLIWPRIYLPDNLNPDEQEYIILHEKMHIKRGDPMVKLVAFLSLCLHWFNPLVWLSFFLMAGDMEMSCDEAVLRRLGPGIKKAYSASLLNLAAGRHVLGGMPLAFGEKNVRGRIKNILRYKKPAAWTVLLTLTAAVILAVCLLVNPQRPKAEMPVQNSQGIQSKENPQISEADKAIQEPKFYEEYVQSWAEAFCGRDGNTIVAMASEETLEAMEGRELLIRGRDFVSFGYSSPWPQDRENGYEIRRMDEKEAQIAYHAVTSDPHVTVWIETITYTQGDKFQVTSEQLETMDSIASGEEFYRAYPGGVISGTKMDYSKNGLGGALNRNATREPKNWLYQKLWEPEQAACLLLNLLDNPNKVKISASSGETNITSDVEIYFVLDQVKVRVVMAPWFEADHIWIPQTASSQKGVIEGYPTEFCEQLAALFPNAQEPVKGASYSLEADLNQDGTMESITLKNLGVQGGDGGYQLIVASEGGEAALPDLYEIDTGFPYSMEWDGSTMNIVCGEEGQILSSDILSAIYTQRSGAGAWESYAGEPEMAAADPVSGVTVEEKEGYPRLVVKQYLQGPGGHACRLGYGITELTLKKDGSWEPPVFSFLPCG